MIESRSPLHAYMVVFEDDGATGSFYAAELTPDGLDIKDSLCIYNATSATPAHLEILWSDSGLHAALILDNSPQAVSDFEDRRGYCRTNFPPPDPRWSRFDHAWDDSALDKFK